MKKEIKLLKECIVKQSEEISNLYNKNVRIKVELSKSRNWAELRNNQVGQLINVLENNSIVASNPIKLANEDFAEY